MVYNNKDLEVRMSVEILNKLDWKERGLYSILKEYANWDDYTCYPSVQTLAERMDCSTNTVRKYLKQLKDKGVIDIEYRVITHKKTKKKFNRSNLYTLIAEKVKNGFKGVLQKPTKPTQQDEDKQVLINNKIDMNDNPDKIKVELVEKFGRVIAEKALQQLSIVTSKGTVVNHLKNYLEKMCRGIHAQLSIINGINQDGNYKASKTNVGAKKNHPQPNKLKGGWGSSSISQAANKYTNDELENIMLKKRLEYSVSK